MYLWVQWAGPGPRWKLWAAFKSDKGNLPDRTAHMWIGLWVPCCWECLAWAVRPRRRKARKVFKHWMRLWKR